MPVADEFGPVSGKKKFRGHPVLEPFPPDEVVGGKDPIRPLPDIVNHPPPGDVLVLEIPPIIGEFPLPFRPFPEVIMTVVSGNVFFSGGKL
jgi:hypothetical protein